MSEQKQPEEGPGTGRRVRGYWKETGLEKGCGGCCPTMGSPKMDLGRRGVIAERQGRLDRSE